MAKRFRFNLEAVLRYRGVLEDQRRRDYLQANRLVEEERVRRDSLLRERGEIQDEIVKSFQDCLPLPVIVASYRLVDSLERSAGESARRLGDLEAEAERRRLDLIEAGRDKRVMEMLKERRREEFRLEQDKLDQAELDETSIRMRSWRRREAAGGEGGE